MTTVRATLNQLTEELKAWKAERAELQQKLDTATEGSKKAEQLQQQLAEATAQLSTLQTQLQEAQAQLSKSGGEGDQPGQQKNRRQGDDQQNPKNPPPPRNQYEVEML